MFIMVVIDIIIIIFILIVVIVKIKIRAIVTSKYSMPFCLISEIIHLR